MPSPDSSQEPVATVVPPLQLVLPVPPAPWPVPFSYIPLLPLFWILQEPNWFFGFDQHSVLMWPFLPQCQQTASLLGCGL